MSGSASFQRVRNLCRRRAPGRGRHRHPLPAKFSLAKRSHAPRPNEPTLVGLTALIVLLLAMVILRQYRKLPIVRNATDLAARALWNCSVVLRGCVCRLPGLAKNGARETDCQSSPPCPTFSADCMRRRIAAVWPPASRVALFQYTVCVCRADSIHPPASGSGRHAAGPCNSQTRLTLFVDLAVAHPSRFCLGGESVSAVLLGIYGPLFAALPVDYWWVGGCITSAPARVGRSASERHSGKR
jgi:hypothetical protein